VYIVEGRRNSCRTLQEAISGFMVSYEDFSKIELRVAKIIDVFDVENSNKLYRLSIDVGEGRLRTLMSGIKKYYKKEELIGRYIIIVANLEPRVIAGVPSEGMLLAAEDDDGKVVLLAPEKEIKVGSKVG